jgi:hypothetical protein
MKDDTNMISSKTSSKIKRKLYNAAELQKAFKLFVLREDHCKTDILELIDTFCKIILKNGGFIPDSPTDSMDEYSLDDFVNIADSYANILALLQNSFAAGLMYGRARFDEDFWKDFRSSNIELDDLLKEHIENMESMPSLDSNIDDYDTEIEDFTDNNIEDDRDPLDDIF